MFNNLNLMSKTEMKLLAFISKKDKPMYERQIADSAGISSGSVNPILKRFTKLGLIKQNRHGRMLFYKRCESSPLLRQFKVFMTINGLLPLLGKLVPRCQRVILFGSCSEGRNGEQSDIDLFILSRAKTEVRRILDAFPEVQGIVMNSVEFAVLSEKDKPLYSRITKGIELYGEGDEWSI